MCPYASHAQVLRSLHTSMIKSLIDELSKTVLDTVDLNRWTFADQTRTDLDRNTENAEGALPDEPRLFMPRITVDRTSSPRKERWMSISHTTFNLGVMCEFVCETMLPIGSDRVR